MTHSDSTPQPAFTLLRPDGHGAFVLLCDHASNHVPKALHRLGLTGADLARHIAWDIGAAGVTTILSNLLDAPAILSGTSRLVVDCNRHPHRADIIPATSDGTIIPGNAGLPDAARAERVARWFLPYHNAVEMVLEQRAAAHRATMVVSIHSMTKNMSGQDRPWKISLSSHHDRRFVAPMLRALRQPGDVVVGDNQPYALDPDLDFSIPYHAIRRELPWLQVEFRQDEVADHQGQQHWARRFATALEIQSSQ